MAMFRRARSKRKYVRLLCLTHQKAGAGEMDDDFAGARIVPAKGDMLGRQRDDRAAHFDLAVIVGHHIDEVAGFAAIRVGGIEQLSRLRRGAAARSSASVVDMSIRRP